MEQHEQQTPPSADSLKGMRIDCLDKGFVRLVDYMGDDSAIVQAARVSYGAGTKRVHEDRGLIRYLMRHAHTTPFEMVELKFHVKLPIFVARQWIRHRTANVNEYSGRYSVMSDEFYVPEAEQIRPQSRSNRQGRGEEAFPAESAERIRTSLQDFQRRSYDQYEELLEQDLARELARINLPLSMYTEWYWKIDLHNLFHFLRLRLDDHAQHEIRVYGDAMAEIVRQVTPMAYEAFEDYRLNSMFLSGAEQKALRGMLNADALDSVEDESLREHGLSKREIREFRAKFKRLFRD